MLIFAADPKVRMRGGGMGEDAQLDFRYFIVYFARLVALTASVQSDTQSEMPPRQSPHQSPEVFCS
jgi:hypothetical protein